jgi:hypothetical protein
VEELGLEKEELENKLQAAEAGFKESLRALQSASSDPGEDKESVSPHKVM